MPVEIMLLQMQRYEKYFRKMSMYNDIFSVVLRQQVYYDKEKQRLDYLETYLRLLVYIVSISQRSFSKVCSSKNMVV